MKMSTWLILGAVLATPASVFSGVTRDANGWTQITPSSDSRLVYVSNAGNDANNGLSPSTPKATIAAANSLIRDGFPDHLLLRRGDTFVLSSSLAAWKNGRSASEPIVFSYYGTSGARPVVKITGDFVNHGSNVRNYQFFKGVEIYKSNSDPASPDYTGVSSTVAMRFVGGGANLRMEDCRIRFLEIVIQSDAGGTYTNAEVRRNIVLDAWKHDTSTTDAKMQGLFVSGVNGYLIEENFFDHNGWSEVVAGAGANMYNHNIYVQYSNAEGGIMRGNIITRGAAHGLQARSGGEVDRNLFALNAIGFNVGGHGYPTDPDVPSWPNFAHDNVVLNGRVMGTYLDTIRTRAVWGIWEDFYLQDASIDGNIVANRIDSGNNEAFRGIPNMNFGSNISYNWDPATDTNNPAWPHPDDDLGDYNASIGGTNSTTAYLNTLRNRPLGSLPWNLTAYAAINYIRAGFLLPPVAGVYSYPGQSTGSGSLLSYGSFEPNQATVLTDMPNPYTVGSGVTGKWFGRVGSSSSQNTTYQTSGTNHYLTVGASANTNGAMQVIPWPGAGTRQVSFKYRGTASHVRVYGANSGSTINKFDGTNTLALLHTISNTSASSWTAKTVNVTLSGSYSHLVIALRSGDFDDVSIAP